MKRQIYVSLLMTLLANFCLGGYILIAHSSETRSIILPLVGLVYIVSLGASGQIKNAYREINLLDSDATARLNNLALKVFVLSMIFTLIYVLTGVVNAYFSIELFHEIFLPIIQIIIGILFSFSASLSLRALLIVVVE